MNLITWFDVKTLNFSVRHQMTFFHSRKANGNSPTSNFSLSEKKKQFYIVKNMLSKVEYLMNLAFSVSTLFAVATFKIIQTASRFCNYLILGLQRKSFCIEKNNY